jgi:hypothetical protein
MGAMDGASAQPAKALVQQQLTLTAGYRLEWTGQYEFMAEMEARMPTTADLLSIAPRPQIKPSEGLSANNAGVRVFRARAALRSQVTRSCGSCATHGCLDCTCGAPVGS